MVCRTLVINDMDLLVDPKIWLNLLLLKLIQGNSSFMAAYSGTSLQTAVVAVLSQRNL